MGPGGEEFPLIRGLQPDGVANFIRSAFEISSRKGGGDQFFTDNAVNMVRRAAQMLLTACGDYRVTANVMAESGEVVREYDLGYDLDSIAEIVHTRGDEWKAIRDQFNLRSIALIASGDSEGAETLKDAIRGYERLVNDMPEKTRGSVVSQIDSVIEPFVSDRRMRKAFCGSTKFDLECLDRGECVILDVDLGEFAASARLVYLLAFEQMRLYMLRRIARLEKGVPLNPVIFVCDEYAEVATASHKSMFRLCREACIAPIVAYQLHSDLIHTVGGKEAADSLVGGFATKFFFRTDDEATVKMIMGLGKAEVERETYSFNKGSSSGSSTGINHGQGGGNSGSNSGFSQGESWNTQDVERFVVDEQLIQSLKNDIRRGVPPENQIAEVFAIGNMHGYRRADIVRVKAWDPPAYTQPSSGRENTGMNGFGEPAICNLIVD